MSNPNPPSYGQPYGSEQGGYPPPVVSGPPHQYGPPPPTGYLAPPPVQPPKKSNPYTVVAIVIAAVAGVIGLLTVVALAASPKGTPAASGGGNLKTTAPAAAEQPTTDVPAPSATPKASDFTLTPKIVRKKCFGEAGCNVTYRVDTAYSGAALSSDDTWLVTYEVTGGEDGTEVGSVEITGASVEGQEETIGTPSSSTKLKIKVTSVEKQ